MNRTYEKIKKLLSLASSSNENEAKAAAAMASKLMIKHNISAQEVNTEKTYTEHTVNEQKRTPTEAKYILNILNDYFFVKAFVSRNRLTNTTKCLLMGTPENVEIASYVFDYLVRSFRDTWNDYKKENKTNGTSKQAFYFGLYEGLQEKLKAAKVEVETEIGIAVVPDAGISRWLNERGVQVRKSSSKVSTNDSDALSAGQYAGKNMEIRPGVKSTHVNTKCYIG